MIIKHGDGTVEVAIDKAKLRAEMEGLLSTPEAIEDGGVSMSMSVDSRAVDAFADALGLLGYEVSFPGQDETGRDGITRSAIHIRRK